MDVFFFFLQDFLIGWSKVSEVSLRHRFLRLPTYTNDVAMTGMLPGVPIVGGEYCSLEESTEYNYVYIGIIESNAIECLSSIQNGSWFYT